MMITLDQYGFTYAISNKPALTDICLSIPQGEIWVVCGPSGSGKSTLLRSLKKAVTPAGKQTGLITGLPEDPDIALVFQNPETQMVAATVINELAFQMENRSMPPFLMKKRMSETVSFFGLEEWLHKPTQTLSGGQKQIAALCAALMCRPKLLLLDEPISQLDPLACAAFLETVKKINTELGITVVMAEHRLDECAAVADRIAFMENGRLRYVGSAKETLAYLFANGHTAYVPQLPAASLYIDGQIALTPRSFQQQYQQVKKPLVVNHSTLPPQKPFLQINDITVSYPGGNRSVLNRLSLTIAPSETVCLLGGNGSGKSTLLKVIAGVLKASMGRVRMNTRRIGYMPQHVRDYFLYDRVMDDIHSPDDPHTQRLAERMGITHALDKHPFDLSGGEQQKAVLLAILSKKPELIVLDEPTKGMDPSAKKVLAELLRETAAPFIIATHDLEFAARWSDRCAMLFDGEIVYSSEPRAFFTGNQYYTTALHKGLRHIDESAFVMEDVFALWELPGSFLPQP